MTAPAVTRTPYEIWEFILLEVIAIISPPFFDVSCTSSTYLAFKSTSMCRYVCGEYRTAEKARRNLRLVCRSWRSFADRWDVRERWIWARLQNVEVSTQEWRGAQRIDFTPIDTYPESRILSAWKELGGSGGGGNMKLTRLEMCYLMNSTFKNAFNALCAASSALTCLRSLALSVPTGRGSPLRRISANFPNLLHFRIICGRGYRGENDPEAREALLADRLHLRKLEVLSLSLSPVTLTLLSWELPAVRHVDFDSAWDSLSPETCFSFLERHPLLETLDLGHFNLFETHYTGASDFWDLFSHLQLLRCELGLGLKSYPDEQHTLKCLVKAGPIQSSEQLIAFLEPWVETKGVKRLDSIVLQGSYLSERVTCEGRVQSLLLQLNERGTKLLTPSGMPIRLI